MKKMKYGAREQREVVWDEDTGVKGGLRPLLSKSPLLFLDANFVPVNAPVIASCLADNKLPEAGVLLISHFSSKCSVQC